MTKHWPHTRSGQKWQLHVITRYSSGGYEFDTFAEAIEFLRMLYRIQLDRLALLLGKLGYPNIQGLTPEVDGWIIGPGGRIDWETLQPLAAP